MHGLRYFKRVLKDFFLLFGLEIKLKNLKASERNLYKPSIQFYGAGIIDFEMLDKLGSKIPGMTNAENLKILASLILSQEVAGDVVEIGSWQGRSTIYLKHATDYSGNGRFIAIDDFKGNIGFESDYVVNQKDLSDLKENFYRNIRNSFISSIELIPLKSYEAARLIEGPIRFLFIDGDHSYNGVKSDMESFCDKLVKGGLIAFDDFAEHSTGVMKVIDEYIDLGIIRPVLAFQNTLIVKKV
jgi:predicted O-methyltransferase YrrM